MTRTTTENHPTAATAGAANDHLLPTLPFAKYISPPIPTVSEQKLCLGFLIGRGELSDPEGDYQIWPPHLLALFSAEDGQWEELRAIEPGDFSLDHDPEAPLGAGIAPADKGLTDHVSRQISYFEACDALLAASLARTDSAPPRAVCDARFKVAGEAPLVPYYEAMIMKTAPGPSHTP